MNYFPGHENPWTERGGAQGHVYLPTGYVIVEWLACWTVNPEAEVQIRASKGRKVQDFCSIYDPL